MDDGYHEIETLFERISLFDRIFVDISPSETSIECDDLRVPTEEDSLLGKTISMFRKISGIEAQFKVRLEKNIPIGAGLGGGSSDAAALLKGLNEIVKQPLTREQLIAIAKNLGADVPFFLEDASFARGSGRGDVTAPVSTDMKINHILINPPFEVSTKEVYRNVSDFNLTKDRGIDRMVSAFSKGKDINIIIENLRNDLQTIVLRDFPDVGHMFSELEKAGAKGVLLSGSGPTVFGVFEEDKVIEAEDVLRKRFSENEGWKVYAARTF